MADLERLPDRQSNPYAPPRARLAPHADSFVRAHRRRVLSMRIIAAVHLGIALLFSGFVVMIPYVSWAEGAWPDWRSAVSTLSFLLLPAVTSLAIGLGIWTDRRWSSPLAMAQGLIVLAIGLCAALYVCYNERDPGGSFAMLPGLGLVTLAAWLRYLGTSSSSPGQNNWS